MEIGNEMFFDQQKLLLSSCSRVALYNHIHSGICDIIWMSSIVHILINNTIHGDVGIYSVEKWSMETSTVLAKIT